jgi:predicted GNAT superfamily acetyltransferase
VSTKVLVRDATAADHAAVLALNNANTPHVNALTDDEFAWLVANAGYFRVAEDAAGIAGFVLCLPPGREYWSRHYKYFSERYSDFLYLDRVVVAPRTRRGGVGRALYDDVHATGAGKWMRVCLEVNLKPPNPISMAFHEALGYRPIEVREYDDGTKVLQMFERPL